MSNPIVLSHSARGKYDLCPKLYQLHYIEKIRPPDNNSTLRFGGSIDKAAEIYLKTKDREACKLAFEEEWGKYSDDPTIEFAKHDFDIELVQQFHYEPIIETTSFKNLSDFISVYKDQEVIKNDVEKVAWAKLNWLSLQTKGRLMISALMDWVDENVEEVLDTQGKIELEDGDGNKVTGLADFVIKIYGYDKPILVDLKTSIIYYQRGSVKESEQLALYYFYLKQTKFPDMERAAFLVLSKQIKKNRTKTCLKCGHVTTGREQTCAEGGKGKSRCGGEFSIDIYPEAVLQYIHDEIPEEFIQSTIEKFNISVAAIHAGKFEPCWTSCDNMYGRRCPYYDYCRTGSMVGLIKKEKKEDV